MSDVIYKEKGFIKEIRSLLKSRSQQGQLTTTAVRWFFPRSQTGPVHLHFIFIYFILMFFFSFFFDILSASNCGSFDEEPLDQRCECACVQDTKSQSSCVFSSWSFHRQKSIAFH